ncbi:hypothetical protein ACEPAF_4096 [Sanghuangporus sanghuang]
MTSVATAPVSPLNIGAKLAAMDKGLSSSKEYVLPPTPPLSDDERDEIELASNRYRVSCQSPLVFERSMGDTEMSYYLPSRADGVNDMYLHLGFRAPVALLAPARVRAAWAYMRLVHPPLAAHVRMEPWEYTSARFAYAPPRSVEEALLQAEGSLEFRQETKDALIEGYLNGPRTLGNERLAYLILGNVPAETRDVLPSPAATPSPSDDRTEAFITSSTDDVQEFDLLICATHFLGDGMALHTFANEFFRLIAGKGEDGVSRSTEQIEEMLEQEWETRWGSRQSASSTNADVLPPSLEEALPDVTGRFRNVAAKIDFKNSEAKSIGGHAFPRKKSQIRHTIVPTVALDTKKTKAVLKRCKENGVSIANAIFSLSAIAWSRIKAQEEAERRNGELPLMMYSALNIRPYLRPEVTANRSYWFTAIGYLNVVLPSFLPSPDDREAIRRTFWHRARSAKKQISQAAKHPLVVSRTRQMALLRGERARKWAREDDEKDAGIWTPLTPAATPKISPQPSGAEAPKKPWTLPPAPSTALIGLSMLGNLDSMYAHAEYSSLVLHTLTTGSRQRNGAALLFGYTFAGKLWLSLGFDEEGFASGMMQRWWGEVLRGVDEFLID